jgi:hypothetical protein
MRTTSILAGLFAISVTLSPLASHAESRTDYPPHRPPVDNGACALSRSCVPGASIDVLPYVTARRSVGTLVLRGVPEHAEIYIDRVYAGHARDFDSGSRRATLPAGVHRVDVRAEGHNDMSFDTRITASRASVHHVSLQPAAAK